MVVLATVHVGVMSEVMAPLPSSFARQGSINFCTEVNPHRAPLNRATPVLLSETAGDRDECLW